MVQEGDYLAVFNSAHRVMKAEQLLKESRLAILLIPAPRQLQTDCGLALRFTDAIHDTVLEILSEHQLLPAFISRFMHGSYQPEHIYQGDL